MYKRTFHGCKSSILKKYGRAYKMQRKHLSDMGGGDFRTPLVTSVAKPPPGKTINIYQVDDTKNPWEAVRSDEGVYYWNKITDETTPIGGARPDHWVERSDPSGQTQLTYWWNPDTDATTALGAMNPSLGNHRSHGQTAVPTQTFGSSLSTYAIMGGACGIASMLMYTLFK